jgi:hypothetical protein
MSITSRSMEQRHVHLEMSAKRMRVDPATDWVSQTFVDTHLS